MTRWRSVPIDRARLSQRLAGLHALLDGDTDAHALLADSDLPPDPDCTCSYCQPPEAP